MATFVYLPAMQRMMDNSMTGAPFDWDADTIRIGLTQEQAGTTTVGTNDNADFVGDLTLDEIADSSYTAQGASGRLTLGSKTLTEDDSNNQIVYDADDAAWTTMTSDGVGNAVGYAFVYKFVTNDAASPTICCLDLGDVVVNNVAFTVQFDAEGVFKMVSLNAPA